MRFFIYFIIIIFLLSLPVYAIEYTIPSAPVTAEMYMPENTEDFADGVWYIFKQTIAKISPDLAQAGSICTSIIAISLISVLFNSITSVSKSLVELVCTLSAGVLLLSPTNTMIRLGIQTVTELSDYGKVLLPVITSALAAQGGVSSSSALYFGTSVFNSILVLLLSKIVTPLIYIYICFSLINHIFVDQKTGELRNLIKWAITWCIKIVLYVFSGYMTITGVISGVTDATALKATKIAVSSLVPVVGNIVSDASDTILISAGIMKNATGIYGTFVILSICMGPFIKLGIQYILLKLTASASQLWGSKHMASLTQDFSTTMGFLLAMTGSACLLHLISIVCFMKGAT